MIICREKWRGRPPRRLRRARPTWISSDLHNSTNQSSDGLFSPTPSRDRRVHSSHSNLLKPKHMVFSRRFFCFNRIRWCQINGHEKSFDLMCISEKVNQPLLRYGNPDIQILGTLKNKFRITIFLTLNIKNLMLLF